MDLERDPSREGSISRGISRGILSCDPYVLQSSEASSKQKGDIITGLEDKINQMAGTVKQLESR